MQTPLRLAPHGKAPHQFAMALDCPVLNGMTADDRSYPPWGIWPGC